MVGNGATDFHDDIWPTYADVVAGLQMIPQKLHENIKEHDCVKYFHGVFPEHMDYPGCKEWWGELMGNTTGAGVNWYDLYRKTYTGGLSVNNEEDPTAHDVTRPLKSHERDAFTYVNGEKKEYKIGRTMNEYTPWMKPVLGDSGDNTLSNYVAHYINREDVRKAMHIPDSAPGWTECNGYISNTYQCGEKGSIWIYPELRHHMKILFYCGDTDGAVPCLGTRRWMKGDLNWDVTKKTTPYYVDDQFEGEVTRYDGMDFATVHGVGHMAPQWKRKQMTRFISAWVHDEDLYDLH